MKSRTLILFALLSAVLWVAAAWSWVYLTDRRESALAADASMRDCRRLADEIRDLRDRPALASDQQEVAAETVRLIESAARSAGIPTDRIVSVSPGRARRLGDTPYQEQPTQVVLRRVQLEPLVKMAHRLITGQRAMRARALRLSAPQPGDTSDFWNAEMELTYLLYDPPDNQRE